MLLKDVIHMTEPVVSKSHTVAAQGSLDAAATIVTADDDVFDLQDIDSELHHRKTVEVGVHDHIGHIAMNKDLSGSKSDQFLSRHTAVRTSDPEVFGTLLDSQILEELRIP